MESDKRFVAKNGTSEFKQDPRAIPAIQGGMTMKDFLATCENGYDPRRGTQINPSDPKKDEQKKST